MGVLKLESLLYLNQVYRFNSIKLAAESIPVSPSTISAALHKLEKEWDVPLLIRTYQGVELTDSAKRIAVASKNLFIEVENVENLIRMEQRQQYSLKDQDKTLIVLLSRGLWQGSTGKLLAYFLEYSINVDFPDLSYNNERYLEMVDKNQMAILINWFAEPAEDLLINYPHVKYIKHSVGKPCVIMAPNSKFVSPDKKELTPKEALELPYFRFTEGYDHAFTIFEMLAEYGEVNIVANISNVQVLQTMMECDRGVSVGSSYRFKEEKDLRYVPIRSDLRFSFVLCYNEKLPEGYVVLLKHLLDKF